MDVSKKTTVTPAPELAAAPTVKVSATQNDVSLPVILAGRYQLVTRLGGGGMAQVFRGHDPHLDRPIAVKLMTPKLRADPEFDNRFRREAQVVSRLNDPHVVVVYDFGIDAVHGPFLVMELLQGETLRSRLNAKGPMPLPHALQLGEQLMLALAHAHGEGVVHRDVKPDNVFLLAQSGLRLHVRVLDFGIARMIDADRPLAGADITEPGSVVGTPRYMAPEQLAGKMATERADLYSAALVLYEALTGQLPEVVGPGLRERRPDVPPDLARLIEQCLNQDPDERPVSATEAYLHLHELSRANPDLLVSQSAMHQLTARFRSLPTKSSPAHRLMERRTWLAGAALTAVLAAGMTAWMRFRPYHHSDRESLFGLAPGDHRDDLVARLGKPTAIESAADAVLAPIVRTKDHSITPERLGQAEVLWWGPREVAALVDGNRIVALVVNVPRAAQTSRGLNLGDSEAALRQAYREEPELAVLPASGNAKTWGVLYRYPQLGLALEVRDGVVTGAALFPRVGK